MIEPGVPTPDEMDEAYDIVLRIWKVDHDQVDKDCYNGHFECSYRSGGPCMNEAGASQAAKLVRLREEKPVTKWMPISATGPGIGSVGVPGREFPDRTVYLPDNNTYLVPFVADDGRVGYRVGKSVPADDPERGEQASWETFVWMLPSMSLDSEWDSVFVYGGTELDPDNDESFVFVALDPQTFGATDA